MSTLPNPKPPSAVARQPAWAWPVRRPHPAWLLLFLPVILAVAWRGDTRDTGTYIDAFSQTLSFPADPLAYYGSVGMEWGFGLLSWMVHGIGLGPVALFFVYSLGTFWCLAIAARRVGLSLPAIAPYYLGSFFLLQQLMQIRQGLGIAFALAMLTLIPAGRLPWWKAVLAVAVAACMHITAVFMLVSARLLHPTTSRPTRLRLVLWCAFIIGFTVLLARAFMQLEVISNLGRLSVYAVDDEYSGERSPLAPANIRAAMLLVLFLIAAPPALLQTRVYRLMVGLFAASLGLRLGFYDFLILSGRLASALGFVEVLLMPMLVRAAVRQRGLRIAIAAAYLTVHAAATLALQAPFLIDDYFTPLHAAGTAP